MPRVNVSDLLPDDFDIIVDNMDCNVKVVVKRFKTEKQSKGGIILSERSQKKQLRGYILKIADGYEGPYQVGDLAIWNQDTYTDVEMEDAAKDGAALVILYTANINCTMREK